MANKPFAIQGADLTLGGVSLQAGTTGVVIPGVTRAANAKVEEVNDRGDQTLTFQSAPLIIDYATLYTWQNTGGPDGNTFAIYEATLDDEGYIDEINITEPGSYAATLIEMNGGNDLFVYSGSQANPFDPFNYLVTDWTQIPFRPKMRAGEIESIGGSGGGASITYREVYYPTGQEGDTAGTIAVNAAGNAYICIADSDGNEPQSYTVQQSGSFDIAQTGNTMILTITDSTSDEEDVISLWANHETAIPSGWTISGSSLAATHEATSIGIWEGGSQDGLRYITWLHRTGEPTTISDGDEFTVTYTPGNRHIWTSITKANALEFINGGGITNNADDTNAGRYNIVADAEQDFVVLTDEGSNEFRFTGTGLKFPDGTTQTTAYTGQSSGASGELYIMANLDGNIITSTDGITWSDPISSGLSGINRVEVHNDVIVYSPGTEGPPGMAGVAGLFYSTAIGTATLCSGTDTLMGDSLYWNQVRYVPASNKWVAVGWAQGSYNYPILAHSDNGISWTLAPVDSGLLGTANPDNRDWQLTDIAYLTETGQYVITSKIDYADTYGGIFITQDITVPLDESVHVAVQMNFWEVAPWIVTGYGGPPGYMILMPAASAPGSGTTPWFGYGTFVENYTMSSSNWWNDSVIAQIGYLPELAELAYDNNDFIATTVDGQVITPGFAMGPGPQFAVSVPLPYTTTDFSISNTNPAVLTYNALDGLENNEKIIITGSGEYNGEYFWNSADGTLYTDQALENGLDASGFATFTSGGTLTASHGTYFDAAGSSQSYYYVGNDDEQVFRSGNGITWTQVADVTGVWLNDFAYGTWGTGSGITNRLDYTDSETGYASSAVLTYDFNVDVDDAHLEVNGNGLWNLGSYNKHVNIGSVDELDDDYLDIRVRTPGADWLFGRDGKIYFPNGTKQTTAYVHQNINLDGGGAAAHFEQEVGFVDGGFSATRHGVADPTFDGGNRLTEENQYNVNGGGA